MWSLVVLGGEFILLLFIGVMVKVERWLLLGGYNKNQSGTFGLVASERLVAFGGLLIEVLQ